MSENTLFDGFANQHLLIPERMNAYRRALENFIITGFKVNPQPGLVVRIGAAGTTSRAYINGYEISMVNTQDKTLIGSTTNYVYLKFTKTSDPIAGTASIIISLETNITGVAPADSLLLATVDTDHAGLLRINQHNTEFMLPDPSVFMRKIITATVFTRGLFARINTSAQAVSAQANSAANIGNDIIGMALEDKASGQLTEFGSGAFLERAQFVTGLVLNENDIVFISAASAGRLTNVAPAVSTQAVKRIGIIIFSGDYIGTIEGNSRCDIAFRPEPHTIVP